MRPVLANMGLVLQLAGILIAFPLVMGFAYNETQSIISLFVTGFAFFFFGFLLNAFSVREELSFRQSCVLLTGVFVILGILGAIPYYWLNAFNDVTVSSRFLNSFFESVSGYTTTGFSLITDPDALPHSLMFYRSFTHLVGGLGIVFILLAFFYNGKTLDNMTRVMNFVRVTDNDKKSLVSIMVVYLAYIVLFTGMLYSFGFVNVAESSSVVMSSLMTGGFSPATDFTPFAIPPAGIAVAVMMVLGATSFMIHYRIWSGRIFSALTAEFWIFMIISAAGVVMFESLYPVGFFTEVFHILSASTGTGFSTIDFSLVPEEIKFIFIVLMFIGGMSLSTAGGIKVLRLLIFLKSVPFALKNAVGSPADKMTVGGREYDKDDVIANLVFIGLSAGVVFAGTAILVYSGGFGIVNSLFEATSAFGTVGLTSGITNLGLAAHLKAVLIVLMIVGRVEVIPFLAAFTWFKEQQKFEYVPV